MGLLFSTCQLSAAGCPRAGGMEVALCVGHSTGSYVARLEPEREIEGSVQKLREEGKKAREKRK